MNRIAVQIHQFYGICLDDGNFIVIQQIIVTGMVEYRRDIRRNIVFMLTQTNNHRAVLTDGQQRIRIILTQNTQCIGTAEFSHNPNQCANQIAVIQLIKQLCHNFCVSFRTEYNTLCLQLFLQRDIIFNDTVVYHGNTSRHTGMGMGVDVIRCAVGCPTGMANTQCTRDAACCIYLFPQGSQTALRFHDTNLIGKYCNTGRVIAAVFKLLETFQKERSSRLITGIANNSTHDRLPPRYKKFFTAQENSFCTAVTCGVCGTS